MLDDVVDKESGAKPKLVTSAGDVGSGVRHIAQDELDAYLNGRLAAARLDLCRTHLDSCDECRAELEDLRTFKANAVGMAASSTLTRELEKRKRQRQLKAAGGAAIAAAVAAVIALIAWREFGDARVHLIGASATANAVRPSTTAAPPPPAAVVPPPAVAAARPQVPTPSQVHATAVARAQAGATPQLPASLQGTPASASARIPGMAQPSAQAAAMVQPTAQAAAPVVEAGKASFALLGPFGDEITDDRPEFAWQPLEGATKYSIIIVDDGLRPIAHTRLKTTTWRPKKPLRRGKTYLWQVTAILKNGTKIMGTGPTTLAARIHITAPAK